MGISSHLYEQLLGIFRTPANRDAIIEAIETGAGDLTADEIAYDNATSGLAATDLQQAVDELASAGPGGPVAAADVTYVDNPGIGAAEVQSALDVLGAALPTLANTTLNNLVATTAINSDLRFSKTSPVIQGSDIPSGGAVSQPLVIRSGNTASSSPTTGTGAVTVQSGNHTNASGATSIKTGNVIVKSGNVQLSGQAKSGDTTLTTGNTVSFPSGNTVVSTGSVPGGQSGTVTVTSGFALNSGVVTITSGEGNVTSGDVNINSGVGDTLTGNIAIATAFPTGGGGATRGSITMSAEVIDVLSTPITNAVDPVNAQDVATKNYVDTVVTGASGSFTSQDGKTITVVNGLITSIV